MRKHLVLSTAAVLALVGQAQAAEMSYSYVQGDLLRPELRAGGGSETGSGLGIEGSFAFGPRMFGITRIDSDKYSGGGASIRFTNSSLGLGGRVPLGSVVDFIGTASLESVKVRVSDGVDSVSDSVSGWGLAAGVRGQAGEKLQWNAGLKYRDIDDIDSIISVTAGGRYYVTPAFALGLDLTSRQYDEDILDFKEAILSFNFRYDFGGN